MNKKLLGMKQYTKRKWKTFVLDKKIEGDLQDIDNKISFL